MVGKPFRLARIAALGVAIAVATPGSLALSHGASSPAIATGCGVAVSRIGPGLGTPDDVAVIGGRIFFGDLHAGAIAEMVGGRPHVLVRGLATPEGIVPRTRSSVVVAEQGRNRILSVDLHTGKRRIKIRLRNDTGQEGVDGIRAAPNAGIYIPDSPYGTLYLLDRHNRLHLIASGMARPVDVIRFGGGLAVADENDNAVWLIRHGHRVRLATIPIPDDLAVVGRALLATSLRDGGVWEIRPRVTELTSSFRDPQGMARLSAHAVVVSDSKLNALYRVSRIGSCASR